MEFIVFFFRIGNTTSKSCHDVKIPSNVKSCERDSDVLTMGTRSDTVGETFCLLSNVVNASVPLVPGLKRKWQNGE